MADRTQENLEMAQTAVADPAVLAQLVEDLSSSSRRTRQRASGAINALARINPALLTPHIGALVAALDLEESQTRWECLEALVSQVEFDSRACEKAFNGVDAALFDEDSGFLHLAAVRFLCKLGATTEKRSEKVWPFLNEAIQCYHGDPEYQEMLQALIDFSTGKLSASVKEQLAERVAFDAENARGVLKRRSALIIENVS